MWPFSDTLHWMTHVAAQQYTACDNLNLCPNDGNVLTRSKSFQPINCSHLPWRKMLREKCAGSDAWYFFLNVTVG